MRSPALVAVTATRSADLALLAGAAHLTPELLEVVRDGLLTIPAAQPPTVRAVAGRPVLRVARRR